MRGEEALRPLASGWRAPLEAYAGEICSLLAAATWAAMSLAVRVSAARLDAATINAIRYTGAAVVMALAVLAAGQVDDIAAIPPVSLGLLLLAVLVGMVIGDTAYFESIRRIGVARALPISTSYPLFTAALGLALLGEAITLLSALGIALTSLGIYFAAFPRGGKLAGARKAAPADLLGLALAVSAAVCWAVSTTLLRQALDTMPVLLAGALRLPPAALIVWAFALRRAGPPPLGSLPPRTLLALLSTGVLGAATQLLFLYGLQLAGVARAATLSSTAPLFAAPAAALLLREPLTLRLGLGILLSVAGIALLVQR